MAILMPAVNTGIWIVTATVTQKECVIRLGARQLANEQNAVAMRMLLSILLLLTGSANARNLPDWLGQHADLLPDVSDQAIEALRMALPESQLSDGHHSHEPLPTPFVAACKTIGNLKHDASKAMI